MTTYVLPFEKMHGIGNDFILLERRSLPKGVNERTLAKLICNRNFGIGADGIIIVDYSSTKDADFIWGYYNNDGSEAEMCGNGMRCFAKYVYERGLTDEVSFSVMTKAGVIKPKIEEDGTVTVNMGKPKFSSDTGKELTVDSKTISYVFIDIGNPHCVIFQNEEIDNSELLLLGPKIEKHTIFPNGVNVEFAVVKNKTDIHLKVWERGAGATLACGTGACAALVAGNIKNLCGYSANVYLPGGLLVVKWDKSLNDVYLNGPATFVYTGQFSLNPALVCNESSATKLSN